jgi:cell wall-associated NlpC family hydrolase
MMKRKVLFPMLALMLCMGAFLFSGTAYAAEVTDTLSVDDVWLSGDTLHITVTDKSAGVTRFVELLLSDYATESDELVTIRVTDGHGRVSNAVRFENPYYVPPTTGSGDSPPDNSDDDIDTYAALIAEAEKYLGYPYVWGGSSPETSFDCSGLICWILDESGVADVGRTTAQGLYNLCTPISLSEAKPGDLIFFHSTYKTADTCTHVALYVGDGMMLHAGDPIQYASFETTYWQNHLYGFGRIQI